MSSFTWPSMSWYPQAWSRVAPAVPEAAPVEREWPRAVDVFPHGIVPNGVRCRDEWVEGEPIVGSPTRVHPDDVPNATEQVGLIHAVAEDLQAAWETTRLWPSTGETPDFTAIARRTVERITAGGAA